MEMKEVLTPPAPVVRNAVQSIQERFHANVIPSYSRFDLVLERGEGLSVWDVNGKRYLGSSVAVLRFCSLGHASPDITQALLEQSQENSSTFPIFTTTSHRAFHRGKAREVDRAGENFLRQ